MALDVDSLRRGGPRLSAGIATADLLQLGRELQRLDAAGVSIVHVDVMDGAFCPPLTFGPPLIAALPGGVVKDVHLMIDEPLGKLEAYVDAGADIITTHLESSRHPHRVLQSLAGAGVTRGLAITPGTPVDAIEPLLEETELLLLLAVNPGWGGQRMLASTRRRIERARELTRGTGIVLAVDGGVTLETIAELSDVDLVVAGSAVFDGGDATANAVALQDRLLAGGTGAP